jgi:glycine dehydrogenase subunit 2
MGIAKIGDLGVDVVHINLHKTFSTPHGGGGPGAGPVAVKKELAPFLPIPVIEKVGETYRLNEDRPQSIGKVRAFYGNFGVLVRAYATSCLGSGWTEKASEMAVLNANYDESVESHYDLPHAVLPMHGFSPIVFRKKIMFQPSISPRG